MDHKTPSSKMRGRRCHAAWRLQSFLRHAIIGKMTRRFQKTVWLAMPYLMSCWQKEICFFSNSQVLMEQIKSKSNKWWNLKWSLWSIGTFCTAWIEGFVTQKEALRRKAKIEILKKLDLKTRNRRFGESEWGLLGGSRDGNCSQRYPGLIRHHPGSIFIYKTIVLKENRWKSINI